jgi:predicted Zn-dependent protease
MALGQSTDRDENPEERAKAYQMSAADYGEAAEIATFDQDPGFHLAALFNQMRSLMDAGDCDGAVAVIKDFIAKDHKDPAVWQSWAICLSQRDDPEAAVAALMISKSLDGVDVPVDPAVDAAVEDAKTAVDSLGPPDFIRAYQEASSGNQIESWFWVEKRIVMSFILGIKNGEQTW